MAGQPAPSFGPQRAAKLGQHEAPSLEALVGQLVRPERELGQVAGSEKDGGAGRDHRAEHAGRRGVLTRLVRVVRRPARFVQH